MRSDISDTLPGVAIAISLVPPLAVVGLLLCGAALRRCRPGAALLFGTNVAAIVATGTVVLLLYRVRDAAAGAGLDVGRVRGTTLALIAGLVVVVMVPLTVASRALAADVALADQARPLAQSWAAAAGWQITFVDAASSVVTVTALGPPPTIDPAVLRQSLNAHGMSDAGLTIRLVVGGTRYCAAGGTTCSAAAPGT